ncbi:hypothetical protein BJ138DRAFT_814813 [Hygrophoropsis aurantiaca]|uniref:Uncharacterized protein n=1 Tax=Hygrophoropsis aurantiaca TaxID=72124 RepID=A0ACB8AGC7_9AGAM|nr:hypothetical protein BJ138DRAFT_814813 [Hygrophoropsis aurantiaca]
MDYDREPSPLTSIASDHEDGSRPITSSSLVANPNSVPATSGSSNSSGKKVSRVVIDSATKGKRVYVLVPGDGKDHWSARSARRQQEKAPTSPVIRRSKPDGSDATPSARKQPSRSAKQPPSALGKRSRRVVLSSEPEEVAVNLPVDSLIDSPIDSDPITNTPHSETRDGLHRAKRARHNLPPKKSMQSSSRGQRRHSGPSTKGPVRKQPPTHRPRDPLTFVPAIASQSRAQQVGHGIGSSNYTPHASMADVLQRTFDNNAYFPHEHKRARIDDKDVKIQSYERRHKADEERHRFDEDRHKLDEERHEADQQELRILKESHEAGQKELAKLKIALQSARTLGHFWPHTCGGTQLETMNIEIGSSSHAANISEDSEVLGPGFSSTSGSNVTSGRTHVRRAQYSGPFARPITPRYGRFHHWRAMNTNSINVGSDGSNISSPISDYHRSTNDPTPNPDRPGYPTPSSDESEQRPIQPESPRPESPPPQGGQNNRTFERSGSPANLPDGEIMFPGRSVEAREKDEDEISMGGSSDFAGYYN